MKILIKHGRVIDPSQNLDQVLDILIEGTHIANLAAKIATAGCEKVIDASGKIVIPGLVDMHVHLREPGREDKETVETGTLAAAHGGVTTLVAMPNTEPAMDSPQMVERLQGIIRKTAKVDVLICGAITKAREGKELTDIVGLKRKGVVAISDDGSSVEDAFLLEQAMAIASQVSLPVICHCEDVKLSGKGVVNRGFVATRLGLRGIPDESEYLRVERDISLAEKTNASLHLAHLSCKESVDLVAQAKKKGLKVTCEVSPHHLFFTEEDCLSYDTNMKMKPPLRTKEDVEALKQGLKDGTVDVIASDHAPHTESEKEIEFDRAEFGVIGLETMLSAVITSLIEPGILSWSELVYRMSLKPAQILGLNKGTLRVGSCADIAIIDAEKSWLVEKKDFFSKSKNSPFLGRRLKGVLIHTIQAGRIVYGDEVSFNPRIGKIGKMVKDSRF